MAPEKRKTAAWITWEVQTRNRSMARRLGIPLYELISDKSRLPRYLALSGKTISIIKRHEIIFVQNPSIVLSFIASIMKIITKKKLVVDAHNSGIFPLEGRNRFLNMITRFICKAADEVIVTNSFLAKTVTDWGGKAIILPDPLPHLDSGNRQKIVPPEKFILFICTWASDEPFMEVIQAARLLPDDIKILVTGNYKKQQEKLSSLPKNVELLGFVDEADYIHLLSQASASMDLTTRDNCLVCGAYESASLQIPCIISDTDINREVFNPGFIYTKNNERSIAEAILRAMEEKKKNSSEIHFFKERHEKQTTETIEAIKKTYLQ